jgi:phosphotransferase system  glucose/maltose/N-acetylglucosamine-specific IIC component
MEEQTTTPDDDHGDYSLLQAVFTALTQYVWSVPVVFGVPGNILAIIVANRKHNRKLSPSIYMTAMGLADTLFLLQATWVYSLLLLARYVCLPG